VFLGICQGGWDSLTRNRNQAPRKMSYFRKNFASFKGGLSKRDCKPDTGSHGTGAIQLKDLGWTEKDVLVKRQKRKSLLEGRKASATKNGLGLRRGYRRNLNASPGKMTNKYRKTKNA